MSNLTQTTVGYYDLSETLDTVKTDSIKVHTFKPGEVIKARLKETQELMELEGDKFFPHQHSIFIDGKEYNVINRASKYLGQSEDDLKAPPVPSEEPKAKGKVKHPSKKSKASDASEKDRCG